MVEAAYALVSNIPAEYHTADLRRFFSNYVERGHFTCFHYRHRPEKKRAAEEVDQSDAPSVAEPTNPVPGPSKSYSKVVTGRVHGLNGTKPAHTPPTCCCIVQLPNQLLEDLVSSFHRKHWLDSDECDLPSKCFIAKISVAEQRDLILLPELRPPNIMPQGNVGTSTKFFLDAIRDCRLPSKLIGKLKLEFPKGRIRKYGSVPFQYEERAGRFLSINRTRLKELNARGPQTEEAKEDSDAEDDDDTCEEWERHEALHNDVQANRTIGRQVNSCSYLAENGDLEQQAGTKQKPYEEEIELVWEKGGSGLNFYTDAQYWKAQEGDFDEQTTDDWDVDMSVYYEKNTVHDMDAVDRLDMRRSEFLRRGQATESVFKKPPTNLADSGRRVPPTTRDRGSKRTIGRFEEFTRGFGGRILKEAGWKEGMGLGSKGTGIASALDGEEDGQPPRDKKGIGYHGQKIVFALPPPPSASVRPPPPPGHRITSAYSPVEDRDPPERVERTNPQIYMKFRDQPIKFLSAGTIGGPASSGGTLLNRDTVGGQGNQLRTVSTVRGNSGGT